MHVALLRGVNVGKANRIAMSDLRELCEDIGYAEARTLLNSGNLIFSAPREDARAAAKIEKEIAARLGVTSRVLVVTGHELDVIIEENPLAECDLDPSRFLVIAFSTDANRAGLEELALQDWGAERLGLGSRAIYLWCANGILESPASVAVGRVLRDDGTSRNWATMKKLQALVHSSTTPRA
jgi:uncharacterized protein (DUF1697 family)